MDGIKYLGWIGLWVGEHNTHTYGAQILNQPCQILSLEVCNAIPVPLPNKEASQAVGELGRGLVEIPKLAEGIG